MGEGEEGNCGCGIGFVHSKREKRKGIDRQGNPNSHLRFLHTVQEFLHLQPSLDYRKNREREKKRNRKSEGGENDTQHKNKIK